MNTLPGDPISSRARKMPAQVQENMRKRYGLDKPVHERYLIYLKGIVTKFDLGMSITYPGQTVTDIVKSRLPYSGRLGIQQVIVGLTIGIILGIIAAIKRGTITDRLIVFFSILFIAMPGFVFAILIQRTFAGQLHWFPIVGWPTGSNKWFGGWQYTILPTVSGCFGMIASYSRYMKTSMLDVVNQDYVLTARSKGLSETAITLKHVLRNSMIPIMTSLPVTLAMCITGELVIERIYSIPGIGQYFVTSINARDYTMIMGQTIMIAILYIASLILVDIGYVLVDPRIRIMKGKR
jgi:oligopeptide transport system permease protein